MVTLSMPQRTALDLEQLSFRISFGKCFGRVWGRFWGWFGRAKVVVLFGTSLTNQVFRR